ncbi:DUF4184 family protein [Kribbella sp. NBC_00709]|uniref:DUF4184 family protein n=1 Tax=Kribbella sp. NBC_00709 TaxID=2975972 RepID=UPI002E2B3CB4|nr:DUF4184 family protein [Kribbella sp. NBC_00709]
MPFTLAHPAAVLPLARRPLVASALVAGAVAPDLLYVDPIYRLATQYISGNFTLTLTHEFTSAVWLDPLLALLMLVVFNLVLKRPLIALAPAGFAARLPSSASPSLPWTVVSAIIGAVTHVVWDSFTHGDGFFVRHFPGVFRAAVTPAWDVNRILQYVSTVGGCLVLAIWLYRWYRRTTPSDTPGDRVPSWLRYVVIAAVTLLAVTGAVVELARVDGDLSGETAIRLVLSGLVSGGLATLAWYVVLWHLARLRRRTVTL